MSEEDFIIQKVKNTVPWILVILMVKKSLELQKKELQKANHEEFRIKKVIKKTEDKLYVMERLQ